MAVLFRAATAFAAASTPGAAGRMSMPWGTADIIGTERSCGAPSSGGSVIVGAGAGAPFNGASVGRLETEGIPDMLAII